MKKPSIAFLRLRLAALAPGNWRDTVNRHPKIANLIAVIIILLVVVDVSRQLGLGIGPFASQRLFTSRIEVRDLHCPARFITAMVSDGYGGAWVASEDSGIYHYQPGGVWQHYDKANSPGLVSNHIYSLCLDAKGRLWAGTLRHGVCVYNGVKWGHYGLLNGPLGSHIFAIAENPYDKSVWMCTEAGVSIYHIAADSVGGGVGNTNSTRQFAAAGQWQYIPQATPGKPDDLTVNGLPPNPDCVAFNADGTAFVCTQCNGLAISCPPYHSWWMVKGPWKVPVTPLGKGLPSNLINAVVAGKHGRIYVATDEGLAWDNPGNPYVFQYERGRDYAAKLKNLWKPPADFKMPSRAFLNHLLPGDHITCLAVDKLGELWLGTWRNGLWINTLGHGPPGQGAIQEMSPAIAGYNAAAISWHRWQARYAELRKAGVPNIKAVIGTKPPMPMFSRYGYEYHRFYVTAIAPLEDGRVLIGHYGGGVTVGRLVPQTLLGRLADAASRFASDLEPGPFWHANLPAAAKAPTTGQLTALYHSVLKNNIPPRRAGIMPQVVPITDDWRTEGNWEGSYGKYCMWLFSYIPTTFTWSPDPRVSRLKVATGPHCYDKNDVRFYQPGWSRGRSLCVPMLYMKMLRGTGFASSFPKGRSEGQLDDDGESYSWTWQGPDLYLYLHIPVGVYVLSLYFFNKDGHSWVNRNRDYISSTIPLPTSYHFGSELRPNTPPLAKMRGTSESRVVNFWDGVWKRFLVRGPMKLAIRVAKNYSTNTTLDGVSLDFISEYPFPYYYGRRAWQAREKQKSNFRTQLAAAWRSGQLTDDPPVGQASTTGLDTAQRILQIMNVMEHSDPAIWTANQRLIYLSVLRWCVVCYGEIPKNRSVAATMAKCYYRLEMFQRWAEVVNHLGLRTPLQIDASLRWDGVYTNFLGLEYGLIRKAVTRIPK